MNIRFLHSEEKEKHREYGYKRLLERERIKSKMKENKNVVTERKKRMQQGSKKDRT
jgi:hypothetical protein